MTFWGLCPILNWMADLSEIKYPINVYDPFGSQGFLFVSFYCVGEYSLLLSTQIYMAADCFLFTSIFIGIGALKTLRNKVKDMGKFEENKYTSK